MNKCFVFLYKDILFFQQNNIYRSLVKDCAEEYSFFQSVSCNLTTIVPELITSVGCLACPKASINTVLFGAKSSLTKIDLLLGTLNFILQKYRPARGKRLIN